MSDVYGIPDEYRSAYLEALLRFEGAAGVTGIDVGFIPDTQEGNDATRIGVRVHVRDERALEPVLPKNIDSVEVYKAQAVYEWQTGLIASVAMPPRFRRYDPMTPGIAVAREASPPGTLGAFVYDTKGRPCLLGAAHVLGEAKNNFDVFQPGAGDGNLVGSVVGSVYGREGDAAVARLKKGRKIDPRQFGTSVVVRKSRPAALGDLVEKSGLTTEITFGVVDGIGRYLLASNWMNGFRIDPAPASPFPISDDGDSGATWYVQGSDIGVGLHVGADTSKAAPQIRAVACHLSRVLDLLKVSLV